LEGMIQREVRDDFSIGQYVGGKSKRQRDIAAKADCILSTFQMCREALDLPRLDTLFLTTPHADVEQPVGRILRMTVDKKPPVIVDFVDTIPTCLGFAKTRRKLYAGMECKVVEIQ